MKNTFAEYLNLKYFKSGKTERKRAVQVLILCFLTWCFLIAVSAQHAFAATTYTERYFKYEVEDGGVVITGYFGTASEVTVPAQIAGNPVYKIASGAFSDCSTVAQVNLPASIMTIEEGAFASSQTIVYYDSSDDSASDEDGTENNSEEESSAEDDSSGETDASNGTSDSGSGTDDGSDSENLTDSAGDSTAGETSKTTVDSAVDAAEVSLGDEDDGDDDRDDISNSDAAEQSEDSTAEADAEEDNGPWYQRIFGNTDISASVTFAEILLIILVPILIILAGFGFYRSRKRERKRRKR
ncbi:MAG: hypothetical protein LUE29_02025 [Lachnospiraceae bacterium]|nr:hypothetical protein [Lachnospiraceae bacterium]